MRPVDYARLFLLYAAQSLPIQFFYVGLPVILRQAGYPLEVIGLVHLALLPWAFKFLWSAWIDRANLIGRRRYRVWILATQLLCALAFVVGSFFPPDGGMAALFILLLVISFACATQDVAVDGWAVSLLKGQSELGIGNAFQGIGSAVGGLVGGGLLIGLYAYTGWRELYQLLALLMVAIALLSFWPSSIYPERAAGAAAASGWKLLGSAIGRPRVRKLALWILGLHLPPALAFSVLQPLLVDQGYSLERLAFLNTTLAMAGSLIGAAAAGWAVSRYGLRLALWISVVGLVIVELSVAVLLELGLAEGLMAGIFGFWVFGSLLLVSFYVFFMQEAREEAGATDFTVLVCFDTLVLLVGGALGVLMASKLGYSGFFGLVAFLSAVLAGLLFRNRKALLWEPAS